MLKIFYKQFSAPRVPLTIRVKLAERFSGTNLQLRYTQGSGPGPIDIWSDDRLAVLNGLLSHLHYMGHHPDEAHHLRDIVQSFNEPVPWWKGWIPGLGASNSTGGRAKIYGSEVLWNVAVA